MALLAKGRQNASSATDPLHCELQLTAVRAPAGAIIVFAMLWMR